MAIFSLPYAISRDPLKNWLLEFSSKRFPGVLEVQSLDLSWLGPQSMGDVSFRSDGLDLSVDSLSLDASLFSLARTAISRKFETLFSNNMAFTLRNADATVRVQGFPPVNFFGVDAQIESQARKRNRPQGRFDEYHEQSGQVFDGFSGIGGAFTNFKFSD